MDLLGKRRKVLRSPSRSIFVVESFTERFKPFVHPIDILIALFLRDDVLDDSVLLSATADGKVVIARNDSLPSHRARGKPKYQAVQHLVTSTIHEEPHIEQKHQ